MVCSYGANLLVYLAVFERKMTFSTLEEAIQDESVEFYVEESSVVRHMLQVNANLSIYIGCKSFMDSASRKRPIH